MDEASRWISVAEGLKLHFARFGLLEGALREHLLEMIPDRAGIMWLSDTAIMVYESPVGLAFDREELNAVIAKTPPVNLADA